MYSDISKDIEESFKNIKLKDYNIFNSSLRDLELNRIFFSRFELEFSIVDMGYIDQIKSSMINEILQSISKKSSKVLFDKSRVEFLNLSNYKNDFELTRDATGEVINYICNSDYKYCIMNSRIASTIQDDSRFHFSSINNSNILSSGDTYFIGVIGDVNLYVDPYMIYNDDRILLFNKFDINLQFLNTSIDDMVLSFTTTLKISYNLGFNVDDSLSCYIIDKKFSNSYNKYMSVLRDTKIELLLND